MAAPDKKLPSDPQATSAGSQVTTVSSQGKSVGSAGASAVTRTDSTPFVGFGSPMPPMEPGTVIAERYEILSVLGEGGMGAVYKAHDRMLDRVVALKTIRPEMSASGDMVARFKQEILLASRITHRNVIRLYDIGEAPGIKFITMECIDGVDLRSMLLETGKLIAADAVEIIRQVCQALEAAHAQGVIHRDLKPQNVMREKETGRIVVMDFGLARTLGLAGMTQTGALVGTMEYMSPEQAMADPLDVRSDIFTVGLIFYELLTGKMPYKAESALASLLKRAQERAASASDVDVSVPRALSNIVAKCLERDPKNRYQNVSELLAALDQQINVVPVRLAVRPWAPHPRTWKYAIAVVLALALVGGAVILRRQWSGPSQKEIAAGPAVSVAVLPLQNASGDPAMDWLGASIADMVGTDIGKSAQVRTVSSDRMHQIMQDLRVGTGSSIDPGTRQRLATFSNADVIVWGQYVKLGGRIRLDLTLEDHKNNRQVPIKVEAENENGLGAAVDTIAQSIRNNLALSPQVVKSLQASAFKPSTNSLEALRLYNEGVNYLRAGKNLEAQKSLESSTASDGQFALAYSRLAQAYSNLGYGDKAEQASARAVDLSGALPDTERYQITAEHARVLKDYPKAIDAYQNLAKVAPQDTDVQFALARLYEETRALDKAREYYDKLLARDPKNVDALLGMGRVQILRDDAQGSLDYLNRAVTLAVQLDNREQKASALDFLGQAYFMLNQLPDALRSFQDSIAIRRAQGDRGGTAFTLNSMARVQATLGQQNEAFKSWDEALRLRREIGDKHGTANTLLDLGNFYDMRGEYDRAIDLTKQSLQLHRELDDPVNQATCLNNIGWVYLEKGDYESATTYLQQALALREKLKQPSSTAETLDNLASASSKLGQYDDALGYFLRALDLWRTAGDKRGMANSEYNMGTLFASQGRYGAALKAENDALSAYRELKEQGLALAQAQGAYANALALLGRTADADKNLKEALAAARSTKNDSLVAHLLVYQGDGFFYTGDYGSARTAYDQARSAAARARDDEDVLGAKLGSARLSVKQGQAREVLNPLKTMADAADKAGMKHLAVEASTWVAEAQIEMHDYRAAQDVLERSLTISEKLNLPVLQLRIHYLLATALRAAGQTQDASRHSAEARRLLDQVRKEAGTDQILHRSDLAAIAAATAK